jgi:hypothetical protein
MWSDRTTISAPTKSSKQSPPFGWAVKLSALFIAVVATFGVAELLLALVARFDEPELTVTDRLAASRRYSREELRIDLHISLNAKGPTASPFRAAYIGIRASASSVRH